MNHKLNQENNKREDGDEEKWNSVMAKRAPGDAVTLNTSIHTHTYTKERYKYQHSIESKDWPGQALKGKKEQFLVTVNKLCFPFPIQFMFIKLFIRYFNTNWVTCSSLGISLTSLCIFYPC